MITSGNVKRERTDRMSASVNREGVEDNTLIELIEECLAGAAKEINDAFVAKVSVTALSSVKNDEEFNADAATLEVDGLGRNMGEEISVLKGVHDIAITLDGYRQKNPRNQKVSKSATIKIVMVPDTCKLTVNVKGPSTAKDFDATAATIELLSGEETVESLTSGEATCVKQGKYTVKVSMDGFATKTQTVSLVKAAQAVTVVLSSMQSK